MYVFVYVCVQRKRALPETSLCTRLVLNPSMEVAGINICVCMRVLYIHIHGESVARDVHAQRNFSFGGDVYVYTFIWRERESELHLRYPCAT